jgi:hypothetical protein
MKNILLVLCLLVIPVTTFVSCKEAKAEYKTKDTTVKNVTRYINGDDFIQFDYNNDETVKKVTIKNDFATSGKTIDFNIAYNNDKVIKELTDGDGEKIIPTYNNGLLTRADIIEDGKRVAFTNYIYEQDLLKKITIYYAEEEGNFAAVKLLFSYNKLVNVDQITTMVADGNAGHFKFEDSVKLEYDMQINPLYKYKDLLALFWQVECRNKIVAGERYNKDLKAPQKFNYTYTYQNNIPRTALVKKESFDKIETKSVVNFFY